LADDRSDTLDPVKTAVPLASQTNPQLTAAIAQILGNVISIPQRAIESSEQLRTSGQYDPSAIVEAIQYALGGAAPFAEKAALGALGGKGIKAFHGSPYDFNAFDFSKIGTGEGAQAYGHGLYFAENPDVAGQYRQSLSYGSDFAGPIKRAFPDMPGGVADRIDQELNMLRANGFGLRNENNAITALYARNAELRGWITKGGDKLRDIIADRFNSAPGKTYEVNINANPEHFLDWDKPLSEQSEHVKSASNPDFIAQHGSKTPQQAYPYGINAQVAEQLRQAGIPGIKYLDQGSRDTAKFKVNYGPGEGYSKHMDEASAQKALADAKAAGKSATLERLGTHNYVVFDDKMIDIIKKYGIGALIAGLGAQQFQQK
jgi:hypothetical protein